MKKTLLLLLVWAFLLAACGNEDAPGTPTPFGFGQTAVSLISAGQPTAVPLADVAAEPETYDGQFIQLTGRYAYLPLLVCRDEIYPGPATWSLVELAAVQEDTEEDETESAAPMEIVVAVGGFDEQLRALLVEGASLTVNGYWRYWEGPVGCGKQAVPRQMWYLRAAELVSPEQLARVMTPAAGVELPLPGGPPPGETSPPPGEEGGLETAVPAEPVTSTVPLTPTAPVPISPTLTLPIAPPLPGVTPTPERAEPTPVVTVAPPGEEPAPTLTPDINGTAPVTPGITGTPAGTITPGPSPTPSSTPQAGVYTIVEVDPINPDQSEYGLETLGAWQKQNWPLNLVASDRITIELAAEPTMDLVIAIYDATSTLLLQQNNALAGQIERVLSLQVDPDDRYMIQVYESNGLPGAYFMTIVGNQPEIVLYSRGILHYGDTRQDTIAADHRHFWYFYGHAGDVIDIATTTSSANQTMLISLYDKNANLLVDESGGFIEYLEEEVRELTLPETGLYLIWLEELAYDGANYSITLLDS